METKMYYRNTLTFFIVKFCVLFSVICSVAQDYTMKDYPSPLIDPLSCNGHQHVRSFVCDPYQILTDTQKQSLNALIRRIENGTKCICKDCLPQQHGFKVGVAILKTVPKIPGKEIGESMVKFGDVVRMRWNIGKCGDDILVVISLGDKKIYSSRGSQVLKILSADVLRDIYEDQGDELFSYEGLKNVLTAFMGSFQDSQDPNKQNLPYIIGGVVGGVVLLVLIIVCIVTKCRRKNRKPNKVVYKKQQSNEMKKKIAMYEQQPPKNEYSKVRLDEPDHSSLA